MRKSYHLPEDVGGGSVVKRDGPLGLTAVTMAFVRCHGRFYERVVGLKWMLGGQRRGSTERREEWEEELILGTTYDIKCRHKCKSVPAGQGREWI